MPKPRHIAALAALQAVAFMPCASAADRTEDDFARACAASGNLSVTVCECSASKARAELTPDGFSLVVATLEGNEAAAAQLRGKLPVDQVMKAGTFMTRAPAACAREAAPTE